MASITGVDAFSVRNLEITTSSPYTSFEASTLIASTLFAGITWIQQATLSELPALYLSSLYTDILLTSTIYTQNVYTERFQLGMSNINSALTDPRKFWINMPTNFNKGFSSLEVRTNSVTADLFEGSFIGDGFYLQNVSTSVSYISANELLTSVIQAEDIYTKGTDVNTLIVEQDATIVSSFWSKYLLILPVGYSTGTLYNVPDSNGNIIENNYNSIVAMSPTKMSMNNTIFFDYANKYVGMGTSNPAFDLDISGGLYCTNLQFSSISDIYISTIQPIGAKQVQASSIFVQDRFQYGGLIDQEVAYNGGGFLFQTTSTNVPTLNIDTIVYQVASVSTLDKYLGVFENNFYSTILVGNAFIQANPHRVMIGRNGPNIEPLTDLQIYTDGFDDPTYNYIFTLGMRTEQLYVSTVEVETTLRGSKILYPNFSVYGASNPTPATDLYLRTAISTLYFNNDLLTANLNLNTANYLGGRYVGILTSTPTYNLHVDGNASFSSLRVAALGTSTINFLTASI